MATCPRCGAFLGEGHQCHHLWRRRLRLGTSVVVAMGLGSFVGMFLLFGVVDHPSSLTIAVVTILGMITGEAARQAIP